MATVQRGALGRGPLRPARRSRPRTSGENGQRIEELLDRMPVGALSGDSGCGRLKRVTTSTSPRLGMWLSRGARVSSPVGSATRSVSAISDSGCRRAGGPLLEDGRAGEHAVHLRGLDDGRPHRCSSRGGPGSTTTVVRLRVPAGTTSAGGGADGLKDGAPAGTMACLRVPAGCASRSILGQRLAEGSDDLRDAGLESLVEDDRPALERGDAAAVRSSAVGPRPPLVTTERVRAGHEPERGSYVLAADRRRPSVYASSTPSS